MLSSRLMDVLGIEIPANITKMDNRERNKFGLQIVMGIVVYLPVEKMGPLAVAQIKTAAITNSKFHAIDRKQRYGN